ncbi:MAG: FAD-dependent oxidoreductase [Ilumatobacteraceae bacterium]
MYLSVDEGWSLRPADGSARPDLVVGGFGHPMTDDVESSGHVEQLAVWATTRLGLEVHDRWSAFDYVTSDGVPYIGRLSPRARHRFVATGFGKWGFTNAMVAARAITDEIEGAPPIRCSTPRESCPRSAPIWLAPTSRWLAGSWPTGCDPSRSPTSDPARGRGA